VSYLRREDKTPNALYNVEAKAVVPATTPPSYTNLNQIGVPGAVWNNNHVSNTNLYGQLEASYRMPSKRSPTAGWAYMYTEQTLPASAILGLSATTPFPASMADVRRDKWRGMADWTPMERVTLQFMIEGWKDRNTTDIDPAAGGKGWRDSGNKFYSVDASYVI